MTDVASMTHRIDTLAMSLEVSAETQAKARRAVAWRVEHGKLTHKDAHEVLKALGLA